MQRKFLIFYIIFIFLPVPVYSQAQTIPSPSSSTANPSPTSTLKTEVSGFFLQGKKLFEVLNIEDLETIVVPDGKRLIPLLRLLKALEIPVEEKDATLFFSPKPPVKITLDLQRKEIRTNGKAQPLALVVGVSDLTLEKEVFLPTEVVGEILSMDIQWDNQMYRFQAKTDQKLGIWSQSRTASLFSIATKKVQANLPSLLPPARPPDFTLDFMEFQIQPYFSMYSRGGSANNLTINSPMQSFWGNAFGGRYRMQFTEPYISWDGSRFETGPNSTVMLNRGDWIYYAPDAEIAAGDSVFGLNDMTLPIIRMTGVRYNGMFGFPEEKDLWRRSPGSASYFIPPQVFTGTAPAGSKVELVINDRRIETQDVLIDTYRFDNIRLAPGSLNGVRIMITEPNGYQRVIEQNIYGKNVHLPRGGLTFISGLGTNRTVADWSSRGLLGGGRMFYGATDTLTLSTTLAAQDNFYLPISYLTTSPLKLPQRDYPLSSFHMGAQAVWLPWEYFLFSGDMAQSSGSGDRGAYDGLAFKIKGELYPSQNSQIRSEFFHYGPDFFNGENLLLRDREGYFLDGRWQINRNWTVSSAVGSVWNNIENHRDNTLQADFQNLEISSYLIPRMTITGGATRASFNWENDGPETLYTLKLQGNLFKGISFDAAFSGGSYPNTAQAMDFFSGLRGPGLSLYLPPRVAAYLYMPVAPGHTLGVTYWEDPNRKRPSVLYNYMSQNRPIRIYTEIGYDIRDQEPFISNRINYLLDLSGRNMLSLQTRYERGEWEVSLLFTLVELFSYSRGKVTRVSDFSISPEQAGVHGRVFIDANANGVMDPGESGVADVQVILDDLYKVSTDRGGYFILPSQSQRRRCEVFINMDTVPASYTPTHALQTAYLNPTGLTEVNLGISPAHSLAGTVQEITPEGGIRPLPGIRVYLTKVNEEKTLKDSVTGKDGSYYLGDLRPGQYVLHVDSETISPKYVIPDPKKMIEILPTMESQEVKIPPFTMTLKPKETISKLLPPVTATAPKPVSAQEQPPAPLPPPKTVPLTSSISPVSGPAPIQPAPVPVPTSKPPAIAPVPGPPAPGTAPVKSSPAPIPAGLTLAAGESPYPFILADAGEYLIIVEKDKKILHLFQYTGTRFVLVKSYPCIVSANSLDKKEAGDLATPLGNYFSLRYIPGENLPERYGYGAFVLNYPNFLDRKARKDETEIWLHGHTPGKSLGDPELQDTKGCIAVSNDVLKKLTGVLKARGTPIVVVNRLQLTKASTQQRFAEELNTFMKGWSKAWESANIESFMSHYSSDFISAEGMNYQAFKQQKERVNSGKTFISVQIENPAILLSQEEKGPIAVFRFTQRYRSNNYESDSRKIFYLKKGQTGWQIIGESWL